MNNNLINLPIPIDLYQQLQQLAIEKNSDPIHLLEKMITDAYQHQLWLTDLNHLRQTIKQDGGLDLGNSQEEMIKKLRQTRQEVFESDYADLY
jgi:hypothetical protein